MPAARVTVTLPVEVVDDIDRLESNRSAFILDAVQHALRRRRRELLAVSLDSPHPESRAMAEEGFDEWATSLPHEDADLVDPLGGTPVKWIEGKGWVEGKR